MFVGHPTDDLATAESEERLCHWVENHSLFERSLCKAHTEFEAFESGSIVDRVQSVGYIGDILSGQFELRDSKNESVIGAFVKISACGSLVKDAEAIIDKRPHQETGRLSPNKCSPCIKTRDLVSCLAVSSPFWFRNGTDISALPAKRVHIQAVPMLSQVAKIDLLDGA
jgi:hypothetical protein